MKKIPASLFQGVYYEHLETINGVRFTPREIDIIACLLSGKASKTVAYFLSIEEKTVETHKYNIMRKLECNSKESIISFIEKSDKFLLIKRHYRGLLMQAAFEKYLQEILCLIEMRDISCSLIYWKGEEAQSTFISKLATYLKRAGIKIFLEARENYKSIHHLVHKIESYPIHYVLYVPSSSLVKALQADTTQEELEILPFLQKHSQNPGSVIVLLQDQKMIESLPQEIQDIGYLDCTKEDNVYFLFFNLLERIVPDLCLEKIITDFKKHYEALYGSFEESFFQRGAEGRTSFQEKKSGDNKVSEFLPSEKSRLLVMGALCLCLVCFLFFIFKENHPSSIPQAHMGRKFPAIRSDLPLPQDNILLERLDLITQIKDQFKKGQQDIQTLALIGIGGSGKTTIARRYARQQEGLVWEINAQTRRNLKESFESLAYLMAKTEEERKILRELKDIKDSEEREEKILLFVKEKLKSLSSWILIFDNVEKFSDIEKYYPSDPSVWGKGKLIVITQNSNIETHHSIHQAIYVKELTPEEKLTLFWRIINAGDHQKLTETQKERIQVFLNNLPSFPLDISVAAYYLKATNISYDDYIKNISDYKNDFDSFQNNILNERGGYSKTRYKIITLSLEKVIKESKDFGEILLFMSLIDSHNIPKELLDKFKNPVVVDNFIYHLKKYSLAMNTMSSVASSLSCLTLHRSTQRIALAYLTKELKLDKSSSLLKDIASALDNYIDKALDEEDLQHMKLAVGHAEMFVKHTHLLPDFIKGLIESKLGCLYYFLNDQGRARNAIKAGLTLLEADLSHCTEEDKLKIAQAFLHIGNIYTELSRYEKAKNLLEKSIEIYNKASFKDSLKVSWGLSQLGNAYRRTGHYLKAKDLLEVSLTLQTQDPLKNQGKIARTLACLGSVYRGLGDYKKSIELLKESLNLYQKYFPEDHFRIGWVLCHLGNIYRNLGDNEKSIKALEEGLKIYRKHFSENHINIGWMQVYLGKAYRGVGNHEKAKHFLEEGLRVYEKHFKEGHERIGRILFHLGNVYRDLGEDENSTKSFERALAIYENIQGKGEIEMAHLFRNMGSIHLLENRLEEAERLISKSLGILKRHNHPDTYIALESLARILLIKAQQAAKQGNNIQSKVLGDQAIDHLTQALKAMEGHFPEDSAHIQKIRSTIKRIEDKEKALIN
ncbi:MAG: tetratricopeptide repeat protein [Candidatus Paracaedibacteraceae bacterium]|nr:tetratricopeptide repeat protein [Candidatus Paracaedibacteraceae bacterium]